jgi:hypothetical protein
MKPRKSPAANGAPNTNHNGDRVRGEWWPRQFRSPEEIADPYETRTLSLLGELRQVGHRREAYENGGHSK